MILDFVTDSLAHTVAVAKTLKTSGVANSWQDVWFTPPVIAAIVSASIAALIGGYTGAYLKETFGDKFLKRRRKREIRAALNKCLGQYFGRLPPFVGNINQAGIQRALQYLATNQESKKFHSDLSNQHYDQYFEEYNQLIDIMAEMFALVYECEHYISKRKFTDLEQLLFELDSYFGLDQYNLGSSYSSLNYEQLLAHQKSKFFSDVNEKISLITSRRNTCFPKLNTIV